MRNSGTFGSSAVSGSFLTGSGSGAETAFGGSGGKNSRFSGAEAGVTGRRKTSCFGGGGISTCGASLSGGGATSTASSASKRLGAWPVGSLFAVSSVRLIAREMASRTLLPS